MNLPSSPAWYGLRYPSWEDLLDYAHEMGCKVGTADLGDQALFIAAEDGDPPVILVPPGRGLLGYWLLAHELGHLTRHSGPKGSLLYGKEEAQASRWAACALIPEGRILAHGNASLDAFIGALSAHYEDLPYEDCPARRLAADIAEHRLKAMEAAA